MRKSIFAWSILYPENRHDMSNQSQAYAWKAISRDSMSSALNIHDKRGGDMNFVSSKSYRSSHSENQMWDPHSRTYSTSSRLCLASPSPQCSSEELLIRQSSFHYEVTWRGISTRLIVVQVSDLSYDFIGLGILPSQGRWFHSSPKK